MDGNVMTKLDQSVMECIKQTKMNNNVDPMGVMEQLDLSESEDGVEVTSECSPPKFPNKKSKKVLTALICQQELPNLSVS